MPKIRFILIYFIFTFLFTFAIRTNCYAQLPSSIIVLEGNVIELTSHSDFSIVSNLPFVINESVEFQCSREGTFSVRIPYESDKLSIDVTHPEYQIIQPKDGQHIFETQISPNTKYTLLIVVVGANADESLKLEIAAAQHEVDRLRSKNVYTQRQLQDLNRQFIDSIRTFHEKQYEYQTAIQKLQNRVSEFRGQDQMKSDSIEALSQELKQLNDRGEELISKLSKAMEEKYLRQKKLFSSVSEDLRLYLSRTKDVKDQLGIIENSIKSNQLQYFNKSLINYSESYESIEGNKDEYTNGISHYWNSQNLAEDYEEIVDSILEDIHRQEIYALNSTVVHYIQEANNGKRLKMKSIKDASSDTVDNLELKLPDVENRINGFLEQLGIF